MKTNSFYSELTAWMGALAKGDERVMILVAAARLDDDLKTLLQKVMLHDGGGEDRLFDVDRPLGTFSSRILLAFRLGLIDRECESYLQSLRKLRNDAAHSTTPIRLDLPPHIDRVTHLFSQTKKSKLWPEFAEGLSGKAPTPKTEPKSCLYFSLYIAIANLEIAIQNAKPLLEEPICTLHIVGVQKKDG